MQCRLREPSACTGEMACWIHWPRVRRSSGTWFRHPALCLDRCRVGLAVHCAWWPVQSRCVSCRLPALRHIPHCRLKIRSGCCPVARSLRGIGRCAQCPDPCDRLVRHRLPCAAAATPCDRLLPRALEKGRGRSVPIRVSRCPFRACAPNALRAVDPILRQNGLCILQYLHHARAGANGVRYMRYIKRMADLRLSARVRGYNPLPDR